jgi:dimethylaniline monooxygenase (N-oxide forming)
MRKSVAVIGAGPSGLCTVKELLQEKHSVTCFEKTDSIGGVFKYRNAPDSHGVWANCRLTSSELVTSFSDYFPNWKTTEPFKHRHFTHAQYIDYLQQYADNYGVTKCIKFQCNVTAVHFNGESWMVSFVDSEQRLRYCAFDALVICTGLHRVPHIPPLPGLESFRGQMLHSAYYKDRNSIRGDAAVFVGAGESGGDIVDEASRRLKRSYLSLRRGVFVIPRLLNGLPNDYTSTRLIYSLPEFFVRRSDPQALALRMRISCLLFPYTIVRATFGLLQRCARKYRNGAPAARRLAELEPVLGRAKAVASVKNELAVNARVEDLIERLRRAANGNQFETFATKTEAFVQALAQGRCELKPGIRMITPTGVTFDDGTQVAVDTIVFCTGYEPARIDMIDPPADLARLYKNCISLAHGQTLAFIGFVRPPIGAIPPMAEMQARWYAQVIGGKLPLPSRVDMEHDVERRRYKRSIYFGAVFQRLPNLVDFSTYMDELAEEIGCKPQVSKYIKRPRLLYKLYTSAFAGVQYRLTGPHARPEIAEKVLLHAPSYVPAVYLTDLILAKVIGGFLQLRVLRPRLSLAGRRPSYSTDLVQ